MLEVYLDDPVFAGLETADLATKFKVWVRRYLHIYKHKYSIVVVSFGFCIILFFCASFYVLILILFVEYSFVILEKFLKVI